MAILDYPVFEEVEVIEPKVYIEDDGIDGTREAEWVDFSDKLGEKGGEDLLLKLAAVAQKTEARSGVSFQSTLSNISWYNGDRFWSRPFPVKAGELLFDRSQPCDIQTINGNTAYFTLSRERTQMVLTGHRLKVAVKASPRRGVPIETDIAYFYVESVIKSTKASTAVMKILSIAQPLLKNNCDSIKDAGGWYRTKNIAFLVRKLLEDQYRVPDWNISDPLAGTLPGSFRVPQQIIIPTDDWLEEQRWSDENPGDPFTGRDSRALSHYGTPPEWDGAKFREEGFVCRCMGLWQMNGTLSILEDHAVEMYIDAGANLLPTGKMGPKTGDYIVIRESEEGNDGSYEIAEITGPFRCTLTEGLNGTLETGMNFTITVMYFGCDNQMWEYNPENEQYTQINAMGLTTVQYSNGNTAYDEDVLQTWRQIHLSDEERFVGIAWANPPYKEAPLPEDWNWPIHAILKVVCFFRNQTQAPNSGDIVQSVGDNYNALPGDLIFREMQGQYWQWFRDEGDRDRIVFNRQAGMQVDTDDTVDFETEWPEFFVDTHWKQGPRDNASDYPLGNVDAGYISNWLGNRGHGVILPFAQKVWMVTKSMWSNPPQPTETTQYPYFYAVKQQRRVCVPQGADTEAPNKQASYGNTYPRGGTIADLETYHMNRKELVTNPQSIGSGSRYDWHAAENSTDQGASGDQGVADADLVICFREHPAGSDPNVWTERNDDSSQLNFPYSFSNTIIPPGIWMFKTSNVERQIDHISDPRDFDQLQWRLQIGHSWGTKGAVGYVRTHPNFNDGIVVFPCLFSDDGVEMHYIKIHNGSVTPQAWIPASVNTSEPIDKVGNWQIGGGTIFNGPSLTTTNERAPYNSYRDSYDCNLDRTFPISSCEDADGNYYYLSLRYAHSTAYHFDQSTFDSPERPTVDIVKWDTGQSNPSSAVPLRIYAHQNDLTYGLNYDTYYTPVDIYWNPDGATGEELLIVARKDGDAFGRDFYKIFFHSKDTAVDSLTPVDAGADLKGTWPNKPMAMAYDAATKFWYGITAESGSLFKFPVLGPSRYEIEILDDGYQAVAEEGYTNVYNLVFDPYTRKTPSGVSLTTIVPLTSYLEYSANAVSPYTIPPLHSDWAVGGGVMDDFSMNTTTSNTVLKITNPSSTSWLQYQGTPSPQEFELYVRLMISQTSAPVAFYEHFSFGPTGWTRFKGAAISGNWTPVSWPGPDYPTLLAAIQSPSAAGHNLIKYGDESTWDVTEVRISAYFNNIAGSHDPEAWLLVDCRGDDTMSPDFQHVGFRVIRREGDSNWTVERVIQNGASWSESSVHTFSGGSSEFDSVPFRMRITSSGEQYTFYVEMPPEYGTDTWLQVDQFDYTLSTITGSVGIGASDAEVAFDELWGDLAAPSTNSIGGVVYSSANFSDDNRIEVDPDANEVRLYMAGALTSTFAVTLDYATFYDLKIQKNLNGDGQIRVFLEQHDPNNAIIDETLTITPTSTFHGPWSRDGMVTFWRYQIYGAESSVHDPYARTIVYGISAPTFHYQYASGDERIAGKYFLWKYDVYYSSRIALADFQGMTLWKALEEMARVCNYFMGFELGDFFFVPRETSEIGEVVFRKHLSSHGSANIRELKTDDGMKEVYNYASITPGLATLEQPQWNLILQNRTEDEFQNANFEVGIDQRDTRQQEIRLLCDRPGRLTPEQGDNTCPQFTYFISAAQFESFLVRRKDFNVAPFELTVSESVVGVSQGDLVEINVQNDAGEDVTIWSTVDSAEDQEDGGHIFLEDQFRESTDFPTGGLAIGTEVFVRTHGRWSNTIGTPGFPRYWPWQYAEDGITLEYPGLESGKYYRVGFTNVWLQITDLIYEANVRAWVPFLDTGSTAFLDEKELYVLGTRELSDIREGDILDITCPGMKLNTGERLTQAAINLNSSKQFGKRAWPVQQMKFLNHRQARDVSRRVIREYAYPKGIHTVTIGFNPLIEFLNIKDKLRVFGVQDREEFEYSPENVRFGTVRGITHDPMNFKTTVVVKDRDQY